MCGRFSLSLDTATLKALLKAAASEEASAWKPSWNIAPSRKVPALLGANGERDESRRVLSLRQWGGSFQGRHLINIRAEGLTPSRLRERGLRRGAIPANGFYEWRRAGTKPLPYFLENAEGGPLLFAALFAPESEAFAIVTRASTEPLSEIHERAPALLAGLALESWLEPEAEPERSLEELLACPQAALTMRAADPRVNSVAFDSPEAQAPYAAPEQLELF